jgi:tRNA-dihydrouridine synthase B
VFDADACRRMVRLTGCDGVALGRIAVARPWVFSEWTEGFTPGPEIFHATVKDLLALMARHFDERAAVRRFRRFALYYAANFSFGHTLYRRVQSADSLAQIADAVDAFFASPPELSAAPNMNFFQ